MIGRIFSISFLIFSILLMVIARTYFGKKMTKVAQKMKLISYYLVVR